MQFAFDYPADIWAVLPPAELAQEDAWLEDQDRIAAEQYPQRRAEARARAERALDQRRDGLATSLYFRPPGLAATGVLHLAFADVVVEDSEFRPDEWIPDGLDDRFPPVVAEFETEHSPHGVRVAYVSAARDPEGSELAGITYGLRFATGVVSAFSELADRDTVGLLQWQADPLIASVRVTS